MIIKAACWISLSLISGTIFAQDHELMGLGFVAPQVSDTSNVENAAQGEIVFDFESSTSGGFLGYDGSSWVRMGGVPSIQSTTSTKQRLDSSGYASSEWIDFTDDSNKVSLSAGTWELHGEVQLFDDGTDPVVGCIFTQWSTEDGDNTNSLPTALALDHGASLHEKCGANFAREWVSVYGIVELASSDDIFLDVWSSFGAAGDGSFRVTIVAKRLD